MVNTQLLESRIEKSGKRKSYLAEKLGLSVQSFRLKCINKYDFTMSQVNILCKELGITSLTEKDAIFNAK